MSNPDAEKAGEDQNRIECKCQTCSGRLAFEPERAGETIQCPHCKMDTVLFVPSAPSNQDLPAKGVGGIAGGAIAIVLVAIGLLMILAAQRGKQDPNPIVQSKVPIDGLFGMKLGEPLPANCGDSIGEPIKTSDWGPIDKQCDSYWVTPPKPNPSFNMVWVTLTATNRLVSQIWANGKDSVFDVANILAEKYGKPANRHFSRWTDGKHTLRFSDYEGSSDHFDLTCTDDALYQAPKNEPDKTGL